MYGKKKEPEEIIALTPAEIKKINKSYKNLDVNYIIKDLSLEKLIPQLFDDAAVTIINNHHMLFLNIDMSGDKYKTFKKSIGGIFSKDLLNFSRNKLHGKYILIEGEGKRIVARLIENEEVLLFQTYHLIHGLIKDKPYMQLKKLHQGEKLSNSGRYIKQRNSEHESVKDDVKINPQVKAVDEDNKFDTISVSLFDE